MTNQDENQNGPEKRNADLTEFQDSTDDEKPSDKAKTTGKLRKWLERHGSDVQKAPRSNAEILVDDEKKRYLVVVQTAASPSKVREAVARTHSVWEEVTRNDEKDIDAVLVATENSPEGRLFNDDTKEIRRDDWDGWRSRAANRNHLPESECVATDCTVRQLWAFAKQYTPEAETGVGALLSSGLDGDSPPKPRALYKTNSNYNGGFPHNWCALPIYPDYD